MSNLKNIELKKGVIKTIKPFFVCTFSLGLISSLVLGISDIKKVNAKEEVFTNTLSTSFSAGASKSIAEEVILSVVDNEEIFVTLGLENYIDKEVENNGIIIENTSEEVLLEDEELVVEEISPTIEEIIEVEKTLYASTNVNVRSLPSTDSKKLCTLNTNQEIIALGDAIDGWQKIKYEDSIAYVFAEYLSEAKLDLIYLGNFKLTAYCPCFECSEGYGKQTASGATCTEGRTIAVDPKVIPYGTIVVIDGYGEFVAEDCGGAIKNKKIDVYFENHSSTEEFGVRYADIYIKVN